MYKNFRIVMITVKLQQKNIKTKKKVK